MYRIVAEELLFVNYFLSKNNKLFLAVEARAGICPAAEGDEAAGKTGPAAAEWLPPVPFDIEKGEGNWCVHQASLLDESIITAESGKVNRWERRFTICLQATVFQRFCS